MGKLDKPAVVHYICEKTTTDFYSLWLNLEMMIPEVIDCFIDNMRSVGMPFNTNPSSVSLLVTPLTLVLTELSNVNITICISNCRK